MRNAGVVTRAERSPVDVRDRTGTMRIRKRTSDQSREGEQKGSQDVRSILVEPAVLAEGPKWCVRTMARGGCDGVRTVPGVPAWLVF